MSSDFYSDFILPYAAIIIKICRAYTRTQDDFEDYYQEVCLQIWRSKQSFEGKAQWSTWVYRVTLNVCMTLMKKRTKSDDCFVSDPVPEGITEDASHFFRQESMNSLYAAIHHLSEIDRGIILLYLEEKSYEEIADIIGIKSNNVGVRVSRIKTKLSQLLNAEGK